MCMMMSDTKEMFWSRLYDGLLMDYFIPKDEDVKTIEQKRTKCFEIIKNNISNEMKDMPFFSKIYLERKKISINKTYLIKYGNLRIDKENRRFVININEELTNDKFMEIVAHEIGHIYMVNRWTLELYDERFYPIWLRSVDEYELEAENFATEIGNYLLQNHGEKQR